MMRVSIVHRSLLLVAALAVLACDGAQLARPAQMTPGGVSRSQSDNQGPTPKPLICAGRRIVVASGQFGPAGGTLLFGNSRLVIPGGALHNTVTITASAPDPNSSQVIFRPEGLHFFKAAGLVLDATGCQTPQDAAPSVVYLSPSGTVLETIPADYDSHWKLVAAPITHFSGYAIAF